MRVFLLTLHVLAAVFVIGPLVYFPMNGLRGIRTGDVDAVRSAARQTFLYSLLSLLVFGLGAAVIAASTKITFGTAWLTISMTLYVVAFAITLALLVPALRHAVTLMEASHTDLEKDETEVRTRSKLDSVRGRAAASAGVVALLFVVITILMVVKPFGPS
ncbi:DUF2269 family protein [Fodinicola acaciae]|uniref:DUF2269 family protein n=1 Tax=Fodinicola acaciae TaxID=2681555 RepID=UPI0013D5B61E|nr:DUF2269 family protein [Fodinicola acaciae]